MNKQQTTKEQIAEIISLLSSCYESISKKTPQEKTFMVNAWYELLCDLDFNLLWEATKCIICQSPYCPTIYDIRKRAAELQNPIDNSDILEAWNEAYSMIQNGIYMTQEEFDKHSSFVKRFFGNSVNNLKSYSTNTEFNLDVVRSNFFKQYENSKKQEAEQKLLPDEYKKIVSKFSENFDIKNVLDS